MELVKKNIHTERIKAKALLQIPLEEDINVSDSRPDVGKPVFTRGKIKVDEVKSGTNKVWVKGRLVYQILYLAEGKDSGLAGMEGELPFMEEIYMDMVESTDRAICNTNLEDMRVNLINSRKLSIQAVISLMPRVEENTQEEVCVDLNGAEKEQAKGGKELEYRKKPLDYLETAVQSMLKYQTDFAAKNPDYIDAPFITNHDMGRVANALRNDSDDLKMAGGLLMTLSGNPFVYYGEEVGMSSAGTKDENKRLPFIWSDTDTAGMTKGPKDADAGITSAFAGVEEQQADLDSILNYYKRALRLRNENPELARGTIEAVETLCDGHQAVITKTWEDSTIAVVYNTSDEAIEVKLTGSAIDSMAIRGYLTLHGEAITLENGVLTMPAQSICIMK